VVADDEPDTVLMLAKILEHEGHVVHTVTHGALVREAVRRFKPEVCILDIEMPGESGYGIAEHISTNQKADRPVLIAISGKWKTQTDKMLAKLVGFDHFFEKPADPRELVAVLDQVREVPPRRA